MCCTFGDQTDIEWWKKYNLPLKIYLQMMEELWILYQIMVD